MGTTKSNRYSEEFKIEAIKKAKLLGNTSEAARLLDVHVNTLSRWMRECGEEISVNTELKAEELEELEKSKPDISSPDSEESPTIVSQLRDEIENLKNERDSLTNEKIELQKELEDSQQNLKQLQKDLQSSQQHIGRMFMENEKLKEKAAKSY